MTWRESPESSLSKPLSRHCSRQFSAESSFMPDPSDCLSQDGLSGRNGSIKILPRAPDAKCGIAASSLFHANCRLGYVSLTNPIGIFNHLLSELWRGSGRVVDSGLCLMKNPLLYRSTRAGERSGGARRFLRASVAMKSGERRRQLALASSFRLLSG